MAQRRLISPSGGGEPPAAVARRPARTPAHFVALLYSIGLPGGARLKKMADLRRLAEDAGFSLPRTVGATGNLIFAAGRNRAPGALAALLEARFAAAFGRHVPIVVRAAAAFRALPARNPFGSAVAPSRIFVRVMRSPYPSAVLAEFDRYCDGESIALVDGDLWIAFDGPPERSRLLSAISRPKFVAHPGTFRALSSLSRIASALAAPLPGSHAGRKNGEKAGENRRPAQRLARALHR
jgi:uncharacterized protein (DUF1697 family)